MSVKFISIRPINKRVNLCSYIGSAWCTCVLRLQPYRDITSILFCRFINVYILLLFLTIFICYERNPWQPTHCWCDLRYTCTCTFQPYRDVTSVLFCRLINVDILLLFLTIFIRYKAEIKDNRYIVDVIYTCTVSSYRSYIKRVVAEWL